MTRKSSAYPEHGGEWFVKRCVEARQKQELETLVAERTVELTKQIAKRQRTERALRAMNDDLTDEHLAEMLAMWQAGWLRVLDPIFHPAGQVELDPDAPDEARQRMLMIRDDLLASAKARRLEREERQAQEAIAIRSEVAGA